MALSLRPARSVACVAALVTSGCATQIELRYCEDEDGRVISCECAPAPREVLGGRVGRIKVRESAATPRGVDARTYVAGRDLQFVLRGRWFVLEVEALSAPTTTLQTWLRCDGLVIPGETVHRSTVHGTWDAYKHEYLALFPAAADADDLSTPLCQLHVALIGPGGLGLVRGQENVYLVNRASYHPTASPDEAWSVAIRDDPAPSPAHVRKTLEPTPPPPGARLCRESAAPRTAPPGTPASPGEPGDAPDPIDPVAPVTTPARP